MFRVGLNLCRYIGTVLYQHNEKEAGTAEEIQAKKKRLKYQTIIDQKYQFLAFAVETLSPWSEEAINTLPLKIKKLIN